LLARANIFARRRIGMIHGEMVRPKKDSDSVFRSASAARPRDELNDRRAHEYLSHSAIATRPASASEIRYTVMPTCSLGVCHRRCRAPRARMAARLR
jgi:hypothetical protein